MEYQLNFRKILDALLKQKWIVIVVGVGAIAFGIIFIREDVPNVYSASSSIYAASDASYQEALQGMNVMRDYVNVIRSRKVAERASGYMAQQLSADEIMGMVWANYASDSKIITITASSSDPTLAIAVANAVADAFIQEIVSITSLESVRVLDSAYLARLVSDSRVEAMKTRLIIAAATVVVAIGIIVLFAAFDTKVVFPAEVTLGGEIELLGIIPEKNI